MICDGNCKEHKGKIKIVSIYDRRIRYAYGFFWYCENAIEEDRKNGFEVGEIEDAYSTHFL